MAVDGSGFDIANTLFQLEGVIHPDNEVEA